MAEEGRRALSHPRADGGDQGARLLGRDHGDAEAAARGAAGPAPGRQQVDRHRRHLAVRQLRLQSRRACGSAARAAATARDQGLGQARVPRISTTRSSSAPATSRSRSAACAASPARARPTSSTSTRRSTAPRARAGSTSGCGPERHNAVKLLLFLDVGGSMDPHIKLCEELFSAGHDRVQESRILLLPQLPLRGAVEGQSPPLRRAHADLGRAPQISATTIRCVFVGDASMSPYEITPSRRLGRAL